MQDTQGFKQTLGINNAYCFPLQQLLCERALILLFIYIAFLVTIRAVTFREGTSN